MAPQWWAGLDKEAGPSKTAGAWLAMPNVQTPAQMAIPLQMDEILNSWSLQQERVKRCKPEDTYEGVDLESESQ